MLLLTSHFINYLSVIQHKVFETEETVFQKLAAFPSSSTGIVPVFTLIETYKNHLSNVFGTQKSFGYSQYYQLEFPFAFCLTKMTSKRTRNL